MNPQVLISFVIPVFNKAEVLEAVIRALAAQQLPGEAEYLFVDDGSTDGSVGLLQALAASLGACHVVTNTDNAGPAVRLNQGAALARGQWLCLLDADELIRPNAVLAMLDLLTEHRADMAHGKVRKLPAAEAGFEPQPLDLPLQAHWTDRPATTILSGRGYVRMAWLVSRDLFGRAGGCDERLFIQDESLPLRLAVTASRFVDVGDAVTYAPPVESRLSGDKRQQHHDRFGAAWNLMQDRPDLPKPLQRALARRAVSAAWKAARDGTLPRGRLSLLWPWLQSRMGLLPDQAALQRLADQFAALEAVRRPTALRPVS